MSSLSNGNYSANYSYITNSPLISSVTHKQGSTARLTAAMGYDQLNRMTNITSTPSGSTNVFAYTSLYNAVNQRTKTTLADDSYWDYTYDDLGQVTSGRRYTADGVQITSRQSVYDLDEIGNRVTSSTPGYVPYTVNDDNQYTIMRDVSLTYDPAGNLLTNGSWTYSWDNENRLIQVVSTSKLIKFSYDTQGRRIEKKVWNNTTGTGTPATYLKYIYDGWNLIAELNGKSSDAVVRTYSWGPEAQGVPGTLRMITDSNGVYFLAYDPNGNVMGLVKASDGTVCAQYEYLPYGELAMATGTMAVSNPIRFSTKYRDNETGLYYYGYRYYSPDMGRWISRDPLEEQGGLNLYGFVNNDPVNKWDLWGMKNYKLGDDDPKIPETQLDDGSGEWRRHPLPSELEGIYDFLRWKYIYPFLAEKQIEYPNAVAHFRHFLGNTGGDYTIKLEKMLAEVGSARDLYKTELSEATNFVKNLKNPPGCKFSITSQEINGGEIKEDENKNWYYAVGKYYAWGKGVVEDCGSEYRLHFEYKFYDPYDWHKGEPFWTPFSNNLKYPIPPELLMAMHGLGLAQEFKMRGSVKKNEPVHIRKR